MAPRAIIYCAALSLMAAPHPSASNASGSGNRPSELQPAIALGEKKPPPFAATSIALKSFLHSILHLRFSSSSSSSCVCAIAHALRGRSVSLLCTRGRLRRLDQPWTAHTDTRSCPPSTSPLHCDARSFENFSGRESSVCSLKEYESKLVQ